MNHRDTETQSKGTDQDHVTLTILDVSRRIVGMQDLLKALYELQGWQNRVNEERRTKNEERVEPARPQAQPSAAPRKGGDRARGNGVITKSNPEVIEKVRGLDEPFHAGMVMTALGRTRRKDGSNVLDNYGRRGWVKRVGVGQYVRTKQFPNGGMVKPAQETAEMKHPPELQAKRRAELESALKQRDRAREAGRDAMVEMYQKDVDRLQALLGD